ncbi:MAG: preprotein translocase subunit SecY [bacterium]
MINVLSGIFNIPDLRRKFLVTLGLIVVVRMGAHIPVAGIDPAALSKIFGQGGLVGFVDLFTGGALSKFSIFAMGIIPYINASIIMQLLQVVVPQLEALAKEGESGRKQIAQYTRYLSIALAAVQSFGMAFWFRTLILPGYSFPFFLISTMVALTAGTAMIMWIAELMTEFGIGNGASLIIFVGIVSAMPAYIGETIVLMRTGASMLGLILLLIAFLAMIVAIIIVQEGQRKIQVQYAKRVVGRKIYGGQSTFIPIRINQGGVIPIIFASAVLMFPATLAQFIPNDFIRNMMNYISPSGSLYMVLYFALVFFFTYFYTAIAFNPVELAENIKKYGGFVMGIRPGKPTAEYLEYVISRLTLVGATFLAVIAVVPTIVENLTGIRSFQGLGSTALLIVVGVALDLVRQIETHLVARQYEGLLA